jgi:hypothetical protein
LPLKLVRKLPATTPSGLSIGIMWNVKFLRKISAKGCSETKNLIIPYTMNEECGSPGCILPVINTCFLPLISSLFDESEFSPSYTRLPIVNSGNYNPPKLSHSLEFSTNFLCCDTSATIFCNLV